MTNVMELPVVKCDEDVIFPLVFTPETIEKFWQNARQFPMIYGHKLENIDQFIDIFFDKNGIELIPRGLFWVLNPEKFTGVFYLTDIREENEQLIDANAHYTFFDRKHHGRVPLVKKMLQFWFEKYGFRRLSAEIPNFVTPQARHFAQECGFSYEGKRRKAASYKDDWFDVNLYGLLRQEALNGQSNR